MGGSDAVGKSSPVGRPLIVGRVVGLRIGVPVLKRPSVGGLVAVAGESILLVGEFVVLAGEFVVLMGLLVALAGEIVALVGKYDVVADSDISTEDMKALASVEKVVDEIIGHSFLSYRWIVSISSKLLGVSTHEPRC
jgi:hypothetical protein